MKPVGVEANEQLRQLLCQRAVTSECEEGYEFSLEELWQVYKSGRLSGIEHKFLAKDKETGEVLSVEFADDCKLHSVDDLQGLATNALKELREVSRRKNLLRAPEYSGPPGAFPWNARPPHLPRNIKPTRARRP